MLDDNVISKIRNAVNQAANGEPKYRRLETAISESISSGSLKLGQQLPADKAFAELVGVSLGTVQKSLSNLSDRGIVTRAPKRGTIVTDNTVPEDDIYVFRFRDPITKSLIAPEVKMLSIGQSTTDGPWHQYLRCERLMRFERMLRVGLEPPVYSQVFVPFELVSDWVGRPPEEFHGHSLHRYLSNKQNKPILRSENWLRAGILEDAACYHLLEEKGTVGLIWDVCCYSKDHFPCTFQRIQLPQNHRPVEFSRFISDK